MALDWIWKSRVVTRPGSGPVFNYSCFLKRKTVSVIILIIIFCMCLLQNIQYRTSVICLSKVQKYLVKFFMLTNKTIISVLVLNLR